MAKKRKLISGAIEVVIGIAILIYSSSIGGNIYRYAGYIFIASGAITLFFTGIKLFVDAKKVKNQESDVEKYYSEAVSSEEAQEKVEEEITE